MKEKLFEIQEVSGGYYKEDIVKNISLAINQGDFLGIIGPNGSGKTTLLRLATGILAPRHGNICFQGKNIRGIDRKEFCRNVALVSQGMTVNFSFTVMEIVLMGRIPHLRRLQSETHHDIEIAQKSLTLTDTLHVQGKRIDELSAGECQRVMLARALTQKPILLFLDEPTSHLDIGHQIQLLDLLKKLNRGNGLTVVMVLHDLNLAGAYCNRIALCNNGLLFKEGTPSEVLTYQNIETVYKTVVLVNQNPITGKPNVVLIPEENNAY